MVKTLLFVLVAIAIYLLLRLRRSARRPDAESVAPSVLGEDIVACSRCGTHVPLSESIEVDGRRYCCPEHGRLG